MLQYVNRLFQVDFIKRYWKVSIGNVQQIRNNLVMFIDNIVYLFNNIHSLHVLFMYCYLLKYYIEVAKMSKDLS